MDHPKCKSCKHFASHLDDWDNPLSLHLCDMVAEAWEMSQWNADKAKNELKPKFNGHLASVSDGSSYRASLNVHADFYCAMHSQLMPDLIPYREIT